MDPSSSHLEEIRGCLHVVDTDLTNLDFLKNVKIICNGKNVLKNNPKLPTPGFLNDVTVQGSSGDKEEDFTSTPSLFTSEIPIFSLDYGNRRGCGGSLHRLCHRRLLDLAKETPTKGGNSSSS